MEGGYYKFESNGITFISLSTLHWSIKNEKDDKTVANKMLDFLKSTLSNSRSDEKFIIMSHVYYGDYNSPADDSRKGGEPQTFLM